MAEAGARAFRRISASSGVVGSVEVDDDNKVS